MNDFEWVTCNDPSQMLSFLRGRASDRKLRLFAVVCCRRIWHLINDRDCLRAIETAEAYADGLVQDAKLEKARVAVNLKANRLRPDNWSSIDDYVNFATALAVQNAAMWGHVAYFAANTAKYSSEARSAIEGIPATVEWAEQAELLRDIMGNPIRPVTIDPSWLTWNQGTIPRIASTIYDDRTFDRMPFLADALEDAGCVDQVILQHCRSWSEHVRGCWVLDALLGKS